MSRSTVPGVQFSFTRRADGIIDASVGPDHSVFNDALEDCVSSRAPRGAEPGLSTYWIERAEHGVRQSAESGRAEPFASGNVTYLRLEGNQVVAGYDLDPEEEHADQIPLEAFLRLLGDWKQRVVAAGGATGPAAMPSNPEKRVWDLGSGDDDR